MYRTWSRSPCVWTSRVRLRSNKWVVQHARNTLTAIVKLFNDNKSPEIEYLEFIKAGSTLKSWTCEDFRFSSLLSQRQYRSLWSGVYLVDLNLVRLSLEQKILWAMKVESFEAWWTNSSIELFVYMDSPRYILRTFGNVEDIAPAPARLARSNKRFLDFQVKNNNKILDVLWGHLLFAHFTR